MRVTKVNVLVQFEIEASTEAQTTALDRFIEDAEHGDSSDNPVYEGTNAIASAVIKNGHKLGLEMADKYTPKQDFDIDVTMRVKEVG